MMNGKQELIALKALAEKNKMVRIELGETLKMLNKIHPIQRNTVKKNAYR